MISKDENPSHILPTKIKFSIFVTISVMVIGMTLFEFSKNYLVPDITIWHSHVVTIAFATIVGTIAVYFAISKIRTFYFLALTEIERRKHLQGEIAKISEHEKRLLGETLHDGLGQQLTGISYMVQTLSQKYANDDAKLTERMNTISDLITNATDLTRNIAKGIYPVGLREHGLAIGLEDLVSTTQNIFNISCDLIVDKAIVEGMIDSDSARQFYLIVQESINNAIKHGEATKISVKFLLQGDAILLEVKDNGAGFNSSELKRTGIGFEIMKYRSELLNGKLTIQGEPGVGTIVRCIV